MKGKWSLARIIGCAATGVIFLAWGALSGNVEQRSTSPDERVIAEVRQYTFTPATEAAQTRVEVRSRFGLFNHTVFEGPNYGADVQISWVNSKTLRIKCVNSNNFRTVSTEQQWGPVSIEYDMQ